MVKKKFSIREIILAFGRAVKNEEEKKRKISKEDTDRRRAVRQKKVNKKNFSEKLRLKIQYTHLIKAKLDLLERDYLRLRKSKKYRKSDLNKVENKIKRLKEKIKDL